MFDLRYHAASLLAVFVALILGIVIGVGLSGRGFVEESERRNLNSQIDELRRGAVDGRTGDGAVRAIAAAGGEIVRVRAIDVPVDPEAIATVLASNPTVSGF